MHFGHLKNDCSRENLIFLNFTVCFKVSSFSVLSNLLSARHQSLLPTLCSVQLAGANLSTAWSNFLIMSFTSLNLSIICSQL